MYVYITYIYIYVRGCKKIFTRLNRLETGAKERGEETGTMLDRKRKKIPMKKKEPRLGSCVCLGVFPLRLNRISDELINGEGILAGVKGPWKKKKKKRKRERKKKKRTHGRERRRRKRNYANRRSLRNIRKLYVPTIIPFNISLGLITDAGCRRQPFRDST